MKRLLAVTLVLAACACSHAPLAQDAQQQIDTIKSSYYAAAIAAQHYAEQPPCVTVVKTSCYDPQRGLRIQQANYNAAAAIVVADEERTVEAIAKARRKTQEFAGL